MAPFLLRKNAKLIKIYGVDIKYPAKLSLKENLFHKRLEEKKREWNHQADATTLLKWKTKTLIQNYNQLKTRLVQTLILISIIISRTAYKEVYSRNLILICMIR